MLGRVCAYSLPSKFIWKIKKHQHMIASGMSSPKQDCHKHKSHPNKYSEEDIADVLEAHKSIHYYESHYSRAQNPHKTYFSLELNVSYAKQ
jgi:hypothetical protein